MTISPKQLLLICLIPLSLLSACGSSPAISANCSQPAQVINKVQNSTSESEHLLIIQQNGKSGFIDTKGRIVIQPQFHSLEPFSENRAAFGGKNGRWGFIDRTGKVIIPPKVDNVDQFHQQRAAVKLGGKWGFIDLNGRIVVQPQFTQISYFSEGRAAVQVGYLWGFIDEEGKFIVKPKFSGYTDFSEGLAGFESTDTSGFIDRNGKVVIELKDVNLNIESLGFRNGLAPVWVRSPGIWQIIDGIFDDTGRGRKFWGFIDRTGRVAIPLKYDDVRNFENCLAAVRIGGKFGFINTSGEMVIQPQFKDTPLFSEGLGLVMINQKYGYVDQTGKVVIEPMFDMATIFSGGLASVQIKKAVNGVLLIAIELWGESIFEKKQVQVEVVIASQLTINGEPAQAWFGTNPMSDIEADVTVDESHIIGSRKIPNLGEVPISVVEKERFKVVVPLF